MTLAGAGLTVVAVACLALALRPGSAIGRRLERIAPLTRPSRAAILGASTDLRDSGLPLDENGLLAVRLASAMATLTLAALIALAIPVGPLLIGLAGYAGFIAPSLFVSARASQRRSEAERATVLLVERIEALVAAGRPPETAVALLLARPSGSRILDTSLSQVADAYALGAPLFRTLEAGCQRTSLVTCAAVARDLERARQLGTGSLAVIRERRNALRTAERERRIEAASQVEGKLMLVLVLCHLPALVALVMIPLFVGLLEGLAP